MVRILLERDDSDLNVCDEDGQSPLSLAVQFGHDETVKMLLEQHDIYPDQADNRGRTCGLWPLGVGEL